jgi:hypothetical protein
MRNLLSALGALAFVISGLTAAHAEGAIALGVPSNIAQNGVAIGVAASMATKSAAAAEALKQCRSSDASSAVRSLCKVVQAFSGKCVAVAVDPRPGTPGFGWAVTFTESGARGEAVYKCQLASGAGGNSCRATGSECDQ